MVFPPLRIQSIREADLRESFSAGILGKFSKLNLWPGPLEAARQRRGVRLQYAACVKTR